MMKSKGLAILILALLFLTTGNNLFSKTRGEVKLSLQFKSAILDTMVRYSVYLPADYNKSNEKYPVFYLLHGYTDDETIWIKNGWVDQAADQGIIANHVVKMIIVMPDAGLTWYLNQPGGDYNYEDMFIKELIPFMEKTYRIKAEKKYRAIGGLSMGGYGALGYSMRHPELFGSCVALSAAIIPDTELLNYPQTNYDNYFSPIYGKGIKGKDRLSVHWNENNPLYLAEKTAVEKLKSINWYISCGDDDIFINGNSVLDQIFRERKIPRQYRVCDGRHNWNYWREHIGAGLVFISGILK